MLYIILSIFFQQCEASPHSHLSVICLLKSRDGSIQQQNPLSTSIHTNRFKNALNQDQLCYNYLFITSPPKQRRTELYPNHQNPSTSICKNIYNKISPDCFSWVFFINTPTPFPASHNNAENNIVLRPSEKGFRRPLRLFQYAMRSQTRIHRTAYAHRHIMGNSKEL